MDEDLIFMRQAMLEAQKAFDKDEIPVGAIVVANGKIIARAHNLTETLTDPTAHAEMQVITAATSAIGGKYLKDCTLYVTLEPCPMCAAALYWAQLSRLLYAASDDKRGFSLIDKSLLHPSTSITSGILADEAADLLKAFFKKKRN